MAVRIVGCAGIVVMAATGCGPMLAPEPCPLGGAQVIGVDETTPDGDTASALVARAAGPWSGTMKWIGSEPPFPMLQMTPGPGTTGIDIELTSTATVASYRPATASTQARITCTGLLSVAALAQVVTADGGLDEQWTITLDNSASPGGAAFLVDLRQQPVKGTLRVVDPDAASWDTTYLGFNATFMSAAAASGTVYYGANRTRGNEHSGYGSTIASWTAATSAADGGAQ